MTIAEAPWLVDFENVTSSGQWCDCTFVVEGSAEPNEVPAHKLILAMASPRFKEMFDEGLSEPNEPMMIPISGVNPEHFRALLRYIYTGRINLTSFEMARELWLEAKKYKLPHLEKKCKSYFYSVVGPSNACPIYEFASKIEDETLMDLCIQIISANTKEVISDKSFVESELNTVLTVLSLDHLNVDSELELYNAVVKYDETRRRPGQSSSPSANSADGGSPPEELSESVESSISENKASLLNVESSQNSPEVKLDSKEPAEEVGTSKTPSDNENFKDVAKYDNEPKTPEQSRSPHSDHSDGEPAEKPAGRLAERLAGLVERLAELVEPPPSSSAELDSKEPSEEVVKSEPPPDNENLEDVAQRTPGQNSSSCADSAHRETPLEELAESAKPSEDKASLLNVESSKISPAVEQDSQEPSEEVRTSAVAASENLEDGEAIKELIKKIRFLTLTAAQFAEGPARSELLTKDQKFVILLNISMGAITTPMPDGFSDSWVRRQQGKAVQETNAKPHPKPRTESCGDTSTKLPTPGWQLYGIIKGLASQDQDELKAAARAVRITTADDNASAKLAQLVNVGVIPLLVAVLNKPWSGVQYDAAWALTNIAQEHAYTEAVVNGGGVSKLLSLLDRGGDLSEQAALAIGHIAQGKRSAVVNDGAITALVSQLMPSTPPKQLVACLWTYGVICENEPYLFRLLPALPFIKNLLAMNNEEVLVEACSILFYMTAKQHRFVFEIDPNPFTPELRSRLTALLGHAAPRVQAAALKALENVMAHNVLKKQCLGGFLDHIINLLICGDHSLVEDAARAVADILKGQPLYVKQVLDKGILDALVPALTGGNDKCKAQAVIAVSAVCSKASASQLRKLAYGAALEPYCQLLADPENSFDVLLGLTNLLQNIEQNAVTALCIKLAVAEFDVPKLLIPMQKHKDDLVRERADHLLKTYFGEYVNEKGRL